MNKIFKYIPKIILLDTILFCFIIVALYYLLSFFNLMFRNWIYTVSAIIVMLGFVVGIIQLLLKIKKENVKIALIITFIILLLPLIRIISLLWAFGYEKEYVVERDGKMFIAYVHSFYATRVSYYDYKNIFVVGNKLKISEYYDDPR